MTRRGGSGMRSMDHVRVSRLLEAAIDGAVLTETEIEHQAQCDACQDLLEIFRKELTLSALPQTGQPGAKRFAA
jgi:hypothetical protein